MEALTRDSISKPDGNNDDSIRNESSKTGRNLELMMLQYPCAKLKLDQFFLEWLSLPEHERLVTIVLENAANNRPLKQGVETVINSGQNSEGVNGSSLTGPPPSPRGSCREGKSEELAPYLARSRSSGDWSGSEYNKRPSFKESKIPQFYFPEGNPTVLEVKKSSHIKISNLFSPYQSMGMQQNEFLKVFVEICELPEMLAYTLFKKLTDGSFLTQEMFENWWHLESLASASLEYRLFCILRRDSNVQWICREDLVPLLRSIVDYHPSLEFLSEHPEFQERYIETVSYRIMYSVNQSGTGKISLREVKRSDLIDALFELEVETEINRVLRYFSYEHFYVIYCKFWELDTDHDLLLERRDLLRYGCHCLTYQIVDRIFDVQIRLKEGSKKGKMDYQDFVWFILSEEDKTNEASLNYWFKCLDLDCDGELSWYDMKSFYEAQLERMENTSCDPVLFKDIFAQFHDLIQPKHEGRFSIQDLQKHPKSASVLFNTLFNLHKFLMHEHRDIFSIRAEQESTMTDWVKFAAQEYDILAAEEDQEGSLQDEPSSSGELSGGF
eukprot:g8914.t1